MGFRAGPWDHIPKLEALNPNRVKTSPYSRRGAKCLPNNGIK